MSSLKMSYCYLAFRTNVLLNLCCPAHLSYYSPNESEPLLVWIREKPSFAGVQVIWHVLEFWHSAGSLWAVYSLVTSSSAFPAIALGFTNFGGEVRFFFACATIFCPTKEVVTFHLRGCSLVPFCLGSCTIVFGMVTFCWVAVQKFSAWWHFVWIAVQKFSAWWQLVWVAVQKFSAWWHFVWIAVQVVSMVAFCLDSCTKVFSMVAFCLDSCTIVFSMVTACLNSCTKVFSMLTACFDSCTSFQHGGILFG